MMVDEVFQNAPVHQVTRPIKQTSKWLWEHYPNEALLYPRALRGTEDTTSIHI